MSRRRKRQEEQGNHERWIVSYADFITLLFAFFVVMYSISSVNEGKYRVLSQTLTNAFRDPARSLQPIQVGEPGRVSGEIPGLSNQTPLIEVASHQGAGSNIDPAASEAPPASAHLSRTAVRALRDISRILASVPNKIQVEGNTDDRPIHTDEFPSNWELSAARAASVVHLMSRMGIAPRRLSAIGYGEYNPVADNATAEGRQKNRRVTLVIRGLGGAPDRRIELPGGAG